jgi:lipoprotein-releasing system ATP-binding protein
MVMAEPILMARDVRKSFGQGTLQTEIIHGISLSFLPGEFTAIIGPSGSGKSTLLYLLGALERPTTGAVFIDGKDIAELDDVELAHLRNRTLGFVFQFHFLLPEFSARENVAMPLLIRGASRVAPGQIECMDDAVEQRDERHRKQCRSASLHPGARAGRRYDKRAEYLKKDPAAGLVKVAHGPSLLCAKVTCRPLPKG